MRALGILTALLMAAGAAQAFGTVLEPKEIAGVIVWIRQKAPQLFLYLYAKR
jgi:hypothetical protein